MDEISVLVKQEPGSVSWNFEEIKKKLEADLKVYEGMVYEDDTIKTAKTDMASLRKLSGSIDDRRKEVKDKCLEPYTVIEAQAKELTDLIEKPIAAINKQVQDYEKRRKQKAKAEIMAYWQQKADDIPENIREKALENIYQDKWENATATKKSWKDGIDSGIENIVSEIETIKGFASKYEEDMLTVYNSTLSLQKSIQKMNELNAMEERTKEAERKKQEAEEKKRQAAETARNAQHIPPVQKQPEMRQPEAPVNSQVHPSFVPPTEKQPEMVQKKTGVTLRISGTEQQLSKIRDYINFTGATYEEV